MGSREGERGQRTGDISAVHSSRSGEEVQACGYQSTSASHWGEIPRKKSSIRKSKQRGSNF